ncbi:hypothetical protein EIP91_000071 [Steccherinum ochraceum]|uniref:Uncharacterized protein n=1 Tax=Steccherinum ochraceum TaxID=92696 RepID=A0A4R0RZK1_9APHY|nr:hypothetical protein EIP91_000071 [Steccherinum ochraceum]
MSLKGLSPSPQPPTGLKPRLALETRRLRLDAEDVSCCSGSAVDRARLSVQSCRELPSKPPLPDVPPPAPTNGVLGRDHLFRSSYRSFGFLGAQAQAEGGEELERGVDETS